MELIVNGIKFAPEQLMSKDELLEFLMENGQSDRALSKIRDRHHEEFGNELVWRYPISDGLHLGTYIVAVKEGFISLPYDYVDKVEGELLELQDAAMFDSESMKYFIDDWRHFSEDLIKAMSDMQLILMQGEKNN